MDEDICNRVHELLTNVKEEDDWTRRMDKIIKDNNIKYEIANEKEFKEFLKHAKDITLRI